MSDHLITSIVTILTAIIGVAIIAVLVSKQAQTGQVLSAATGGFSQILGAAESPVTGAGGLGGLSFSPSSFSNSGLSFTF